MNCIFLRRGYGESGPKVDYSDNFADNDWAKIIEVCQAGLVPTTWKVGDQKAMTINGTSYPIDIIGIQHDDYADGSGKAPFTFQLHNLYLTRYKMENTNTNINGWKNCVMRKTNLPAMLKLMPSEVKTAIKEVNKKSSAGNKSSTINTTADKLFLLSEIEVKGTATYSKNGEGTRYQYYANGGSTIKQTTATQYWWTRSPYKSSVNHFCLFTSSGREDWGSSNQDYYASPAFCF